MAFVYGALLWGFISSFYLARFLLKKNVLSLFIASFPTGFIVANALYLHILPKWMATPFLLTTDIWATLITIAVLRDMRIKQAILDQK